MEKLQARLQAASTEYQKLQNDLSVAVDSRQRLDAQLQENEMVKKVWTENPSTTNLRKLRRLRFTLGVRPIDSRKRSLQTYRTSPGETGPTGGKNEREPTAGIDPGRHVALQCVLLSGPDLNWQRLESDWKRRSRKSEENSTRRKWRYVLIN
jgi:hypothetical protein